VVELTVLNDCLGLGVRRKETPKFLVWTPLVPVVLFARVENLRERVLWQSALKKKKMETCGTKVRSV